METSQKRRRYQKDLAPADDIVTLIHLVRQNPTLYNYKLQPNQRRRIDILNGWAQIAAQIGNKYSVEECRRKWKNLRDTYHQYRLRKCKIGDGLSKWRYAKDMEFLSNVYQPKLKSHRIQATTTTTTTNFSNTAAVLQNNSIHAVSSERLAEDDEHVVSHDIVHSSIISVNEADTFILTAYEDVTHDNDVTHEDPNMVSHHENSMEGCVELVKHEHTTSLDDEGPNGGEVDYEEVCLYEEGGNAPSVDCETIIGAAAGSNSVHSDDAKYHYIDTSDFCMSNMNATPRSHYSSSSNSVIGAAGTTKLKSMSLRTVQNTVTIPSTPSTSLDSTASAASIGTSSMHLHHALPELTSAPIITNSAISTNPSPTTSKADHRFSCSSILAHGSTIIGIPSSSIGNGAGQAASTTTSMYHCAHQREECDLFFDFLKKKIQRFPPEEITSIQVEFLNCVLRREADHAQKNFTQQVINNTSINNTHVI